MKRTRRNMIFAGLILAVILALPGLYQRMSAESSHRSAGIVTGYRDLQALSGEEGLEMARIFSKLEDSGLRGLMVGELTGEQLAMGALSAWFGPVGQLPSDLTAALDASAGSGALWFRSDLGSAGDMRRHLRIRFPGLREFDTEQGVLMVLPCAYEDLLEIGVVPDLEGLRFAEGLGVPVIYRPAPSDGLPRERVFGAIAEVLDEYPGIRCLAPSGSVVAGYPDTAGLAALARERKLALAQVEFSRQVGASSLVWRLFPAILPMHSVTIEEIQSRGLSRRKIVERMVRAGRERSLRLIVLRPESLEGLQDLEAFATDMSAISHALEKTGHPPAWPEPYPDWGPGLPDALALALVFVLTLFGLIWRYRGTEEENVKVPVVVLLSVVSLLLGLAVWKVGVASRLAGAFAVPFVASLACLEALEGWRKPWYGLSAGLGVLLAGGLCVAAFYGNPLHMLRLKAFSGVKLTLLLPPLIVLLHDLKRRIHPESFREVLSRPPLWGELFLIGVMVAAAGFMALRSGNVSVVPGWEVKVREGLEQLLLARPRNKELFVGYPCLVLWYLYRRQDLWIRYREVFRLGATLAFASAGNSFCHFHTHLGFTLLRVFNGLWTGLLAGVAVAALMYYVVLPGWRRFGGVLMD